jgi:3-oxoisoapionate decarboxylase
MYNVRDQISTGPEGTMTRRQVLAAAAASVPAFLSRNETLKAFRQRLEAIHMRLILDTPLPRDANDVERFDAAVKACKDAGAYSLHAAMTQRRYEEFDTFAAFKAKFEQCQRQIELAERVLAKRRLRRGIENHKGWRSAEQAAWLERVSSEWVGVHLDFGNNISLCGKPGAVLRRLPYQRYGGAGLRRRFPAL